MKQISRHVINHIKRQVWTGRFIKRPFTQACADTLTLHYKADGHKFCMALYAEDKPVKRFPSELFRHIKGKALLRRQPVIDMADNWLI